MYAYIYSFMYIYIYMCVRVCVCDQYFIHILFIRMACVKLARLA